MRIAVDEFSSIGNRAGDSAVLSGAATRPGAHRSGAMASRRPGGPHRPANGMRAAAVSVPGPARGPHPAQRLERARVGLATLATTALLTAAAVTGLLGIAQLRDTATPSATQTVQIAPGESLSELAQRVAPGNPVRDTVNRIMELNGLHGDGVAGGRILLVPAAR